MARVTDWVKREFWTGYSIAERIYLLAMLALQIIVFCIVPDTPLAIIAGISGVISVVLCAKGKVTFYFIGFVQTISYLFLAWEARFYGEVLGNVFYLVTMVWGIFVWKANMHENDDGTQEVQAKKFTPLQWILSAVGTAAATIIMGMWLESIGSQQAYTDAATNVLAIFAQLLMVRRYREQWLWWLVIDVLCLKMWFVDGNWSMVAMYVAWIVNCIYGWYTWTRLNKRPLEEEAHHD